MHYHLTFSQFANMPATNVRLELTVRKDRPAQYMIFSECKSTSHILP